MYLPRLSNFSPHVLFLVVKGSKFQTFGRLRCVYKHVYIYIYYILYTLLGGSR